MSALALTAALLISGQTAEPAAPAPAPAPVASGQAAAPSTATETGTRSFTPDFFADARPNTAYDMVQRIPGFSISQDTSVRGFSGAAGNVLFDGARPASKTDALSDILTRIPASEVVRIDLISGGAPGIDMQGFSQVINVIRRQGASRQHVLMGGFWYLRNGVTLPVARYELNGRDGERIYEFALSTTTSLSDGAGNSTSIRRDGAGGLIRSTLLNSEAQGVGGSVRARLQQPLFGGTVELSGNASSSPFTYDQQETGPGFSQTFREHFTNSPAEISLRYERRLAERWTGEVRAIQRLTEREGYQTVVGGFGSQRFDYDNLSGESIGRVSLKFAQREGLNWEFGGEGAYNFLDARQSLALNDVRIPLPSDNVRVEELRGELYGTLSWRALSNLTVDAGLRVEFSRISQSGGASLERSFTYPKPRLLVTWTPTPSDQVRIRLEREVSQLDFGDFAASASLAEGRVGAGNQNLEPQITNVAEATYEHRFWGDGVISVTGSVARFTNAIDVIPVIDANGDVFSAPGNIGDGSSAALVIDTVIPTDRLGVAGGRLHLRGSWVNTEVTDPTTGVLRRTSGNAGFIPTVGWTHDIQSWRINYSIEWQAYFEDTTFRIDELAYEHFRDVVTAFVEYKPDPNWTLRLQFNQIGSIETLRTAYFGPRNAFGVAFTDARRIDPDWRIQFRVRRTF